MSKITVGVLSRNRPNEMSTFLTSVLLSDYHKFEMSIVEEADTTYLKDPNIIALLKQLKLMGIRTRFMHPKRFLGVPKAFVHLASKTKSDYLLKVDDDHIITKGAIKRMKKILDTKDDVAVVGAMSPILGEEMIELDEIPEDFNRWTGRNGLIWNDYTLLRYKFPPELVEVDFVRSPFMVRMDLLRETNLLEEIPNIGYSLIGSKIPSEICNTLVKEFDMKIAIDTGAVFYNLYATTGGTRGVGKDFNLMDEAIYLERWKEFHKERMYRRT